MVNFSSATMAPTPIGTAHWVVPTPRAPHFNDGAYEISRNRDLAVLTRHRGTRAMPVGQVIAKVGQRFDLDLGDLKSLLGAWPLFQDPPVQLRTRGWILNLATEMEPFIGAGALIATFDELVGELADGGVVDLAHLLEHRLFARALARAFRTGEGEMAALLEHVGATSLDPAPHRIISRARDLGPPATALMEHLGELTARLRRDPRYSAFFGPEAAAQLSADGLSVEGVLGSFIVAATEVTATQLVNIAALLVGDPRWAAHWPDEALRRRLVEELIRRSSAVRATTFRLLSEPLVLGEMELSTGATVLGLLEQANMDPDAVDPDPIVAAKGPPVPHFAFGYGTHRCVGSAMARGLLEAFAGHFIQRGSMEPVEDHLYWQDHTWLRRLDRFPVRLTPR